MHYPLVILDYCQASVNRLQKFLEEIWFVIAASKLLSYPHFNPCWVSLYYHRQLPAYKRHHKGHKEWSFPLRNCSVKVIKSAGFANLVPFTEKILIVKLHFWCSDIIEAWPKRKGDQVCWLQAEFEKCTADKTKFLKFSKKLQISTQLEIDLQYRIKYDVNTIEFSCPNFYESHTTHTKIYFKLSGYL